MAPKSPNSLKIVEGSLKGIMHSCVICTMELSMCCGPGAIDKRCLSGYNEATVTFRDLLNFNKALQVEVEDALGLRKTNFQH